MTQKTSTRPPKQESVRKGISRHAKEFGRLIRIGRLRLGITSSKMAEMVPISRVSFSCWENGRTVPRMEHLHRLSDMLKIDLCAAAAALHCDLDAGGLAKQHERLLAEIEEAVLSTVRASEAEKGKQATLRRAKRGKPDNA